MKMYLKVTSNLSMIFTDFVFGYFCTLHNSTFFNILNNRDATAPIDNILFAGGIIDWIKVINHLVNAINFCLFIKTLHLSNGTLTWINSDFFKTDFIQRTWLTVSPPLLLNILFWFWFFFYSSFLRIFANYFSQLTRPHLSGFLQSNLWNFCLINVVWFALCESNFALPWQNLQLYFRKK